MGVASKGKLELLSNGSATGAYELWPGGKGHFAAVGTYGGATVTLQFKGPNDVALAAGTNTTLTADGAGNFELPPCQIRALVAGGSPSALYAHAVHIGD